MQNFIDKIEDYKYNAVNGNWETARIVDEDVFEKRAAYSPTIQRAIQLTMTKFKIMTYKRAVQDLKTDGKNEHNQAAIKKLKQDHFPWVYVRHDNYAYPLVKNILWNVLNQIESNLKR